ncbi:hypothetical protein [Psychrobacter sp. FDAARGOS_221]|uniref:hypothetical protein n=1 Tax=Psychrobacter sp. FDAARGOS_221 TaxID=1975705 RepID=UPI00187D33C9|nr:hypothetical protein [Psychrobacter sp. FDAARGOS_221]
MALFYVVNLCGKKVKTAMAKAIDEWLLTTADNSVTCDGVRLLLRAPRTIRQIQWSVS